jgi:colanic acid biosynthesis glycosyl transferase WcaI
MRRILIERGVDPEKIHLTPNWIDDEHLLPDRVASDELRGSLGLPPGRLFMYAGNMGELQGLEPLVEAFGRSPGVNLALVGNGVARPGLQALALSQGMSNVHFVESQPTDRIGRFIAASDVQIVSLKDTPLLRATMPSKVQTSMAAGRPILAHASGDVAAVVTHSGAGMSTRPGDLAATIDTIRALGNLTSDRLLVMGRRARTYYEQNFSPAAGLDRIERMLEMGTTSRKGS